MRVNQIDVIKAKIAKGEMVYGSHINIADSSVTESLGMAGFDFLWVDWEHSAMDRQHIQSHLIAARAGGTAAFVRIPWNDPVLVKPILEMGPDGIVFPMIRTAGEARNAVKATTYPPEGERGFGPRRANDYGLQSNVEYLSQADQGLWRIMQIEHVEAVRNLESILAVEGVDTIVIGPNDLSGSAGLLGQTRHPRIMELLDEIAEKCNKAGKPFGVSMGFVPETVEDYKRRGCSWMACGSDTGYIVDGGAATLAGMRKIFEGK